MALYLLQNMKKVIIASETKVYMAAVKLFNMILDVVKDIPREYKFTVGDEMQRLSIQLLTGIQRAYMVKEDRVKHLKEFTANFEVLNTLIRTCGERKWISIKKHAQLAELTIDIGKQITGWKNSSLPDERSENAGGQG